MITNLGPNATRTTGDLTTFVGELSKRADANRDGSLTGAEFAQYLTQLLDKPEREPARLEVADQAAEILAAIRDRAPKTPFTAPPPAETRPGVSTNGRVTNG